jgi:hypothetical protein
VLTVATRTPRNAATSEVVHHSAVGSGKATTRMIILVSALLPRAARLVKAGLGGTGADIGDNPKRKPHWRRNKHRDARRPQDQSSTSATCSVRVASGAGTGTPRPASTASTIRVATRPRASQAGQTSAGSASMSLLERTQVLVYAPSKDSSIASVELSVPVRVLQHPAAVTHRGLSANDTGHIARLG